MLWGKIKRYPKNKIYDSFANSNQNISHDVLVQITFQTYSCQGDSGGPMIWEDNKDKKRAYLLGIIKGASMDQKICGNAVNGFYFTTATSVTGIVLPWIKMSNYPEIEECLRPEKPSSLPK